MLLQITSKKQGKQALFRYHPFSSSAMDFFIHILLISGIYEFILNTLFTNSGKWGIKEHPCPKHYDVI